MTPRAQRNWWTVVQVCIAASAFAFGVLSAVFAGGGKIGQIAAKLDGISARVDGMDRTLTHLVNMHMHESKASGRDADTVQAMVPGGGVR